MRPKNQDLIDRMLKYIDDYYKREGYTPNTPTIAAALNVNKSQIHRYLAYLDEEGIVEYKRGSIKTPTMMKVGPTNYTGIVGTIPCGQPDLCESEQVDEYISLPVSIFGHGELFMLRAHGNSMINAGIDDGDLVVVRKTNSAEVGDIVAAITEDDENTLKRIIMLDGRRVLHPENDDMDDILTPFKVQGVAIYVIKKLGAIV